MYEQYFGLSRRPFLPAPTLECVVEHAGYAAARDAILRCIASDSGICVLTAPAGLGKSLLCQDLHTRIEKEEAATVVYLCSAQFPNRRSMLQAILFEIHENYQGLTEDESRLAVIDAIRTRGRDGHSIVVIVDEAHLVSSELLEELRILAEPHRGSEPRMQLILAGQLEFEERLADRDLDSLNQRIGCHAVIEPLTQQESAAYIASRLTWAGGGLDLFSHEALALIVNVCDGNPRCIHQLCDHCFLSALATTDRQISLATVKSSFDDLRSLPLHWNDAAIDEAAADALTDRESFTESYEPRQEALATRAADARANYESGSAEAASATSDRIILADQNVASLEIGGEESLFRSVAPWAAQTSGSTEDRTSTADCDASQLAARPELVPDDDPFDIEGVTVVDDPYARIDRASEATSARAIPEAPDLMRFLSQFATQRSTSESPSDVEQHGIETAPHGPPLEVASQNDEESLLETIRDLRAELKAARAQADRTGSIVAWSGVDASSFDVIEPEDDAPSGVEIRQPELETVEPVSARESKPIELPQIDEAVSDPSSRYSRLFTRIRQRRRAAHERLDRDDII